MPTSQERADEAERALLATTPGPAAAAPALAGLVGPEGMTSGPRAIGRLSPGQALALQRSAGNRAVVGLLDRRATILRDPTVADPPAKVGAPEATPPVTPTVAPGGPVALPVPAATPTPEPSAPPTPVPLPAGPPPGPAKPPGADAGPSRGGPPGVAPAVDADPAKETPKNPGDPHSGFDWAKWWDDHKLDVVRTGLEAGRLVPGYGALAGLGADITAGYQDMDTISKEDAPYVRALVFGRNEINTINGFLGHWAYVNQLVQDGATVSVFGVVITPVTAGFNSLIKGAKLVCDTMLFFMDGGLWFAAAWKASKAKPGSPSSKAWLTMYDNYAANFAGTTVASVLDVIDAASGGFANGEPIKQGVGFLSYTFKNGARLKSAAKSFIQGLFNVWGGTGVKNVREPLLGGTPEAADAKNALVANGAGSALPRRVAGSIILEELTSLKTAYQTGDVFIDQAMKQLAGMRELGKVATGGKDPFIVLRDAAAAGVHDLETRAAELEQMASMSGSATEMTAWITTQCDAVLAAADTLRLPAPPPKQEGSGLADAVGAALNPVGALAGLAADQLVAKVRTEVDGVRESAQAPFRGLKANAAEIGEFMHFAATEAGKLAGWARERAETFRVGLEKCQNGQDVMDLILRQVFEMLGLGDALQVEDLQRGWKEFGVEIDEAIAWAERLRDTPEPEDDGAAPGPRLAPPPPPGEE